MKKRLYHFTAREWLPSILQEAVLRTTDPNLYGDPDRGQRVVWLLDVPSFPVTPGGFLHGISDGTTMTDGKRFPDKTAVRITVEVPDAQQWGSWLSARRHETTHVEAITRVGGGKTAAKHWFVVPRPIPSDEWIEIRDMHGDRVLWSREQPSPTPNDPTPAERDE